MNFKVGDIVYQGVGDGYPGIVLEKTDVMTIIRWAHQRILTHGYQDWELNKFNIHCKKQTNNHPYTKMFV
jgi:hypothetical protein